MPAPQSPRDEPGLPILIVRFGSVDETLRPGDGPVFIGRQLPAQLRVDDPRISRTHARIESAGAHWVAVDEASTNGMFLDGAKVSTVTVTDGMTLHLGHAEGIAVKFSFIDPDAGTIMATHAMPSGAEQRRGTVHGDTPVRTEAMGGPDIARAGAAVAARREELGYPPRHLSDDGVISHARVGGLRARAQLASREHPRKGRARSALAAGHDHPRGPRGRGPRGRRHRAAVGLRAAGGDARLRQDRPRTAWRRGSRPCRRSATRTSARRPLSTWRGCAGCTPPPPTPHEAPQPVEIILALSDVRRTYSDLMLRAATAPSATLGQRLYAARHRAQLSAEETAAGSGVDVDAVNAVEAERAVSVEVSAALEDVVYRLTNR